MRDKTKEAKAPTDRAATQKDRNPKIKSEPEWTCFLRSDAYEPRNLLLEITEQAAGQCRCTCEGRTTPPLD
ncbi:hypothetical protein DsansV1_C18g0148991 [Dioscorea sansibarensis]